MDSKTNLLLVEEEWDLALPSLQEFVRIPNLSPGLDCEWATNGLLDKAVHHVAEWVRAQTVTGCVIEVQKDEGFSPFLFIEIASTLEDARGDSTFLMYGHLDKQPHGPGWDADIEPTSGLIRDGRLYGRGSADDGYAAYASIIAVKALQRQGIKHPRIVIIAEAAEESMSMHLAHYVEKNAPRIGKPTAVFCLDSTALDFSKLWITTSLRGVFAGTLEVSVMTKGFHSGAAGGIVPDVFSVAMQLLCRVKEPGTEKITVPEVQTKIPVERQEQMQSLITQGYESDILRQYPWKGCTRPHGEDMFALIRANTWESSLAITGQEGLPTLDKAGAVLQPSIKLMMSFRTSPLADTKEGARAVKEVLEKDPPCGASVSADFPKMAADGWNAPDLNPALERALNEASKTYFDGKEVGYAGAGGTIPLMNMLGSLFPDSAMIVTGICGPETNMHGPNEFLPIDYTKKFTASMALVMGTVQLESTVWPEDVPLPVGSRPGRKTKRTHCFRQPGVFIGQCLCCL
mmetsp:Transcript_122697/g.212885  ORF Transcript_122697/g.212885 Transcript_122697/m.212885 type:complete len:516 (+) Transcript_122697:64-1611(+)